MATSGIDTCRNGLMAIAASFPLFVPSASAAIVNRLLTINSADFVDWYSGIFDPALVSCAAPPPSPPYDNATCTFFSGYTPATRAMVVTPVGTGTGTLDIQYNDITGEITQVNSLEIFLPKLTVQVTTDATTFVMDPADPTAPGLTYLRGGTLAPNATTDPDQGAAVGAVTLFRHDDAPNMETLDLPPFSTVIDSCSGSVCALFIADIFRLDGLRYQLNGSVTPVGADSYVLRGQGTDFSIFRIDFTTAGLPDTDNDGQPDATDNCTFRANQSQCDSDGDGYGNLCDGDLNNNGATNAQDTTLFRQQLGQPSAPPTYNEADINCNGVVNAQDSTRFRQLLGSQPGPSGLHP